MVPTIPGFPPTHELIKACLPERWEKQRVQRLLGYADERSIYHWCEDTEGSGRANPLDMLEVILEHARLHHPSAAFAITAYIEAANARSVGAQALGLDATSLLAELQPGSEKEALEALKAFTSELRKKLLGGDVDLDVLLKEVQEAEREFERARVMLQAAIEARDKTTE